MKYLPYIFCLMIGALVAWAVIPKKTDYNKNELKEEKKEFLNAAEVERRVQIELTKKDTLWVQRHRRRGDSLISATREATYWKLKYERFKNSPVTRYTVPQLDSAVSALIKAAGSR